MCVCVKKIAVKPPYFLSILSILNLPNLDLSILNWSNCKLHFFFYISSFYQLIFASEVMYTVSSAFHFRSLKFLFLNIKNSNAPLFTLKYRICEDFKGKLRMEKSVSIN